MASMTQDRPARKSSRKAPPFACKLVSAVVEISGVVYTVEPIDPHAEGTAAFRLVKHAADSAVYDVVRDHSGLVRCDCPSYVTTHDGTSSVCKHGRALVALGLVVAPSPVPNHVERSASIPGVTRVRDEFDEPAPAPNFAPVSASNPTLMDAEVFANGPRPAAEPAQKQESKPEPEPIAAPEPIVAPEPTPDPEPAPSYPATLPAEDPADDADEARLGWDELANWELGPPVADWGYRKLPTGPDRESAAFESGYTAGRESAEAEVMALELDNARLRAELDALRSELLDARN